MHSMKIKEVLTGSPSCRDSGGGIRAVKLTLCAALLAAAAGAQPAADWTITTFAGNGEYGGGFGSPAGDGGPAVYAQLSQPAGVAMDGAGNLFIADTRVAPRLLLEYNIRTFPSWLFRVLSGRRSQIEFPTVEVDGVDEVLLIAETARRGLDPLNP